MKTNNASHRPPHPSDTADQQLNSSSNQCQQKVCPYCVNSEYGESSETSSPSIAPFATAANSRDSYCSYSDSESASKLSELPASHDGVGRAAASQPPSVLKSAPEGRPGYRYVKTKVMPTQPTTTLRMPYRPKESKAAGAGNRPKKAANKSVAQTVAPAVGKVCRNMNGLARNGGPAPPTAAALPAESGGPSNSASVTRTVPPAVGKICRTQLPSSHTQLSDASSRPEELQSLTNDPVSSAHQQTSSDRVYPQSASTGYRSTTADPVGQQKATSEGAGAQSITGDRFGASQPVASLRTQPNASTTKRSPTGNQIETRQPSREAQRPDSSKSGSQKPQTSLWPAANSNATWDSGSKTSEPNLTAGMTTSKPSAVRTDTTKTSTMLEKDRVTAAKAQLPTTQVEFSKLRTGSPEVASRSSLRDPGAQSQTTGRAAPATTARQGTPYPATTARPMRRCADPSAQSESACGPEDELRTQTPNLQKATVQHSSRPAPFTARHAQITSRLPSSSATYTAQSGAQFGAQPAQSTVRSAYRSGRPTWNRASSTGLSVEDVGADGGRAYIIRRERRENVDWRRKPRYKVKQTATSRLRYGYWFANCGRRRVKAFRGDWSRIPAELLRDWEVYQNYFRYRFKDKRKRTSSLVRKLIAGKYRPKAKPAVAAKRRPISRMSPLVPSQPSPPKSPRQIGAYGGDDDASDDVAPSVELVGPPAVRGSNVRDLLARRMRAQQRQRELAQRRQAQRPRADARRQPQIEVRGTVTSRLRKTSTLQPCAKPVTPTLWHGSVGEMDELKRKIAQRRQRLRESWLRQTSALMKSEANEGRDDESLAKLMAGVMVVGAPMAKRLGAVSAQCANAAHEVIDVGAPAANSGKREKRGMATNARTAQHGPQLSVIPESDWSANSCGSCAGAVAGDCGQIEAIPVAVAVDSPAPRSLRQNRSVKKKSFVALRKLFSIARWMIPPAIPIQQNLTCSRRQQMREKT